MVMRSLLAKHLSELGVDEIEEAGDGDAAVALALRHPYDVILLDWHMPKKTGFDVLKVIRSRSNKVPIVMVTTQCEKALVLEAIKAGVTDYVFKPFTKETVQSKVRKILGLPGE